MKKYILAFDQGTTSSRAILFDREARVLGVGQEEFEQYYPEPGWVEHDPEAIWKTQWEAARKALKTAELGPENIAALGITNQRETTLVWDRKTGKPLYNAIVWQDRRTAPFCDRLREKGLELRVREKTGLLLDPYFSATKIAWLLDRIESGRARARRGELAFGTVDSWLIWKLSAGAVHVTDVTNASRTLLMALDSCQWDEELLEIFDIPKEMLPIIKGNSETVAEVALSELKGVPISGMAGDQQAALFGQMCVEPGRVKNTYGTGCFMLMHTGDRAIRSSNRLLSTVAWKMGNRVEYALEGSVFNGGAVVQWLRDGLGIIKESSEIEMLAAKVKDNGGVYLVPAFTGMGAPYWDAYARGAIFGLTRGCSAAHIARAALESIAYQSADLAGAMAADAGIDICELRADGGASANGFLLQFQSDIMNVSVIRPRVIETTALGAAFFAGLAVGYWKDRKELDALWREDARFEPKMGEVERSALLSCWEEAVRRSKSWQKP